MFDRQVVTPLLAFWMTAIITASVDAGDQPTPDLPAAKNESLVSQSAISNWQQEGWPLLKQFCIDCHNGDTQEAEVDLSLLRDLDLTDPTSASMQRVLEMVRFGAMPPEDAKLPTESERKKLVAAIDEALFAVTCDLRPRPGKVTARRLNRAEYNHTIRDLFGIDLRPADDFPSDEVGAGFDNNGDVLSLSPMLMEKYLSAAESIAKQVIVDPATLPKLKVDVAADRFFVDGDAKTGRFNGRFLSPDAFAWFDFTAPVGAEYRLRVRCGNAAKGGDNTRIAIYNETGLLLHVADEGYYGGSGSSQSFDTKLKFDKGDHRLFIEPIEDDRKLEVGKTRSETFAKLADETIKRASERRKKPLKPDDDLNDKLDQYPFMLRTAELNGPTKIPDELLPSSQHEILQRHARFKDERWHDVEPAATYCLQRLMHRAFREPVTDEEVKPYAELVVKACQRDESYYRGMQIAITAVLVSPRFLFRVETPPQDWKANDDDAVRLTPYQLATRLSYFLWSSTPDDRLMEAANRDDVSKKLDYWVTQMLDDARAEALATQFASQWLGLRNLDQHEADTSTFKDFDPKLMKSMSRETEMLFMHMLRENRPVGEMLTADYTFLNRDLARHYGIDHDSTEFKKVSLKGTPRRGLLSHASMLTLTSNPTRTSPVKRGKWILENVLGTPPPDPPANVPELEATKTADDNASLRKQLEIHRESPTCASCHRVMDQLGFGLEQFDAIGRYRTLDGKSPIDASGVLPGGRKFNGAAELSDVLGTSEREAFARTVIERLLTFAIGRELSPTDRCVVDEIVQKTKKDDYRLRDLILQVTLSRPFQYYDNPE